MKAPNLSEPKQRKTFRDKYPAVILAVAALLFSITLSAQSDSTKYSQINGYGFKYKRMAFDSVLMIPNSGSPHTPYRAGALRYRASDSTLQLYTGYQWTSIVTGVGNGVDTAYMVNDTVLVIETPDQDFMLQVSKRHVDTLYRKPGQDSIFYRIAGVERAIKDSSGTAITLNNIGTGYALVATPGGNVKKINPGYGIDMDSTTTANTITIKADTNELATQYDLTQFATTDTFLLGRNLEAIDDTLKTKDTLISATPDLAENSTIVATTEWVKDQGYGTGSGSAAGSTGDIQFKGSDGLFKASPGNYFFWDSAGKRLEIGNPSVHNNTVEIDSGNININTGGLKIDDGLMIRMVSGSETRINEAGFSATLGLYTGGTRRALIDNTVFQISPTLNVATTIQVGGVDVIKDLGTELHIGAGAFWRKTRFYSNGSIVGFIDTARWGLGNTAPTARLHLTPFGTGQYGAALKITSGSLLAGEEAGAIENDGDHIYYTDNAGARHQLDQQSGSSYTFTNGLTESGGTAKLGGTLTENTTINTGGFTTDWTGSNDSETSFTVTNTGSTAASAIAGTVTGSTGAGVTGTSTSGNGVVGTSSSNYGVVGTSSTTAAFRGQINVSSSNAVENIISLLRTSSSGAGANGLGAAIQYELETATNGTSQTAGRLAFLWSDATNASRTSAFEIYGVNNTTTARKAALAGNGQWTWDGYGSATHSVTPATTPVISSSGVVGERVAPKIYTALLSQSGASAPTAVVLGTNEIGSIVWTRNSTGNYTGTLSSAFTSNKTWLIVQQGDQSGSFVNNILSWTDANSLLLTTTDNTGTPTDGFTNMSIEIRVYP